MAEFGTVFVLVIFCLLKLCRGLVNQLPVYQGLPTFFSVYENAPIGTIVHGITAIDLEGEELTMYLDEIGEEILKIVNEFGVENATGRSPLKRKLALKKTLDRETQSSYLIQLFVKDYYRPTGRESRTGKLSLFVRDVNDNNPIFINTPYVTSLEENTPSDRLYQVETVDADSGMSKRVLYDFTDECKLADCKPFLISTTSGIVELNSISTLDYETRNRYNLDILAKDRGVPSLTATTTLVVKVIDQSDEPPEFEKSSYRQDIKENTPVNTKVVQTKAFDGDRGINNSVKYFIVGGDDNHYFRIDNSTGTIFVNSAIDRDAGIDYFELIVEAREIPSNATGNTTVFITIQVGNDNKPTFQINGFTYTTSIPKKTLVGTAIFFGWNIMILYYIDGI